MKTRLPGAVLRRNQAAAGENLLYEVDFFKELAVACKLKWESVARSRIEKAPETYRFIELPDVSSPRRALELQAEYKCTENNRATGGNSSINLRDFSSIARKNIARRKRVREMLCSFLDIFDLLLAQSSNAPMNNNDFFI